MVEEATTAAMAAGVDTAVVVAMEAVGMAGVEATVLGIRDSSH